MTVRIVHEVQSDKSNDDNDHRVHLNIRSLDSPRVIFSVLYDCITTGCDFVLSLNWKICQSVMKKMNAV